MPKTPETYLNLCTQYYEFARSKPDPDAYRFYLAHAKEADGLVLEAMCGTGSFLIPLLEAGIAIHGVDASQYMLDRLHLKAKAKNLNPVVFCDYVESFVCQEKYAFIFISPHTFGLITDPVNVRKALETLYHHLKKGGVLVFDAFTNLFEAIPLNQLWRGSRLFLDDGSMLLASFCDTPFENHVSSTICRYELIRNNQIERVEVEEMKMRFYDEHNLVDLLKEIGFSSVKVMDKYDKDTKPCHDSQCIVYECKK